MVCTRPDLSQAISMVSRYMHDPGQGHWEVVKWILRYIKCTIDIDLVFKKDVLGKQECIGYVDSGYVETSTTPIHNGICVYLVPSTGQLTLYSIVYCHIIYHRDGVYSHDRGYEGGNLVSRVA